MHTRSTLARRPKQVGSALCWAASWLLAALAGAQLGCSTVDRDPTAECQDDADCGTGAVCSVEQGICVPEELPPRAALGFDIREGDARIELLGCDPEVGTELGSSELRILDSASILDKMSLSATLTRAVSACPGDCTGECDEDALTCIEPVSANLDLSASSRLGLTPLASSSELYDTNPDPPLSEGELPTPVDLDWPRYQSAALEAHAVALLEVAPAESGSRGSMYRAIADPLGDEVELDALAEQRCHRGIIGDQGAVQVIGGDPVGGATIEFVHEEAIASLSTVLGGSGPACDAETECPTGWACNLGAGSCALDLEGVTAGSTTSITAEEDPDAVGGFAPAWLYTYCEGIDASEEALNRQFLVRVTTPADTGLPNAVFSLDQPFFDPGSPGADRRVPIDKLLCLPDWRSPQTVTFEITGDPVELLTNDLGVYSCCSTDCLPAEESDVDPTPPPSISSCEAFTQVRFETPWEPPDQFEWALAGCTPTATNSDGSAGRYVREVNECPADEPCSVSLTPGHVDAESIAYTVTIEQPQGSVFRSSSQTIQLDAETADLGTFELQPRVLLRGRIVCADGSVDCSVTNAVFAAERLRDEDEDGDPPGPYYYQSRVDENGQFLMPVDPGLYVVTAYSAVGQPGGPAPFEILDLREGSAIVETTDGVPTATIAKAFELDDGVLVRVLLRDFDASTTVTPLDRGSWMEQSDFAYDLNDPDTCYSGEGKRGCLIRRLRPSDAPFPLLLSKLFQFTTRSRGSDQCG
ncbi:hypothetical protein G6O69_27905 [Pseudenhygromyxa sp. WMMC2535]|uniref:hypothetical protein n=1 Tax=Pseudenhygromyxa sp. WMMC2535 TaxID=2712867 RepID=UPI0015581251|nr:hypothetical protein [Pseudenhygromyxa sp. WMMC2535]NVB41693.1 hypothetical protein [Pseudenhygromyxa sp. WMMC2535]